MINQRRALDMRHRLDINALIHLNNFIFLVFAICTDRVYAQNLFCYDPHTERFLYFVLYGNLAL